MMKGSTRCVVPALGASSDIVLDLLRKEASVDLLHDTHTHTAKLLQTSSMSFMMPGPFCFLIGGVTTGR